MGIPPDFRNPVVGVSSSTTLLGHLIERGLQEVALDILPGIECLREAFDQGPMVLFPIAEKFFRRHPGFPVNTVDEFNHVGWGLVIFLREPASQRSETRTARCPPGPQPALRMGHGERVQFGKHQIRYVIESHSGWGQGETQRLPHDALSA